MSMIGIVLATVIVGGTGLFIGIFLGLADKKFAVEVDEKEEAILGVLVVVVIRDVPDLQPQLQPVKLRSMPVRSVVHQ